MPQDLSKMSIGAVSALGLVWLVAQVSWGGGGKIAEADTKMANMSARMDTIIAYQKTAAEERTELRKELEAKIAADHDEIVKMKAVTDSHAQLDQVEAAIKFAEKTK
jgi:hypothetical protein